MKSFSVLQSHRKRKTSGEDFSGFPLLAGALRTESLQGNSRFREGDTPERIREKDEEEELRMIHTRPAEKILMFAETKESVCG